MQNEIERLVSEINQLHEQYRAEVGPGRRVWPRSIRERVERLDEIGVPAKQISEKTGIGYETVLQWRFKRRRRIKSKFQEVAVTAEKSKAIPKIDTVTVPKSSKQKQIAKIGTVTVTTPEGYRIETSEMALALQILKELRGA